MSISIETIEAEVLKLSPAQRSRLLDTLIASLNADPAIEQAWMTEARRRDEEVESGSVEPVALEDVLTQLRADVR